MAKYPARDLVLKVGATTVGNCGAIGMVGSQRDIIDASAYGDDWKDYVSGQQDGTEVEVTVWLDPANAGQDALAAAYDAGTSTTFDLSHADSSFHVTFPALVTAYSRGGERDGVLSATATLKILNPGVTDA